MNTSEKVLSQYDVSKDEVKKSLTKVDIDGMKMFKSKTPPVSLTALGQGLVNSLWKELQKAKKGSKAGELGKRDKPPISLHAADQSLVTIIWAKLRNTLGFKEEVVMFEK